MAEEKPDCLDCNKQFHPADPAPAQPTGLAKSGVVINICPVCGTVEEIPSFAMVDLKPTALPCLKCRKV